MIPKPILGFRAARILRGVLFVALVVAANLIERWVGSTAWSALVVGVATAGFPSPSWSWRGISTSPFGIVSGMVFGGAVYFGGWVAMLPLIPVWLIVGALLSRRHAAVVAAGGGSPEEQLQHAIETGDNTRAKTLIDVGADIGARVTGETALGWAVIRGNREVAEYLLARGADIRQKTEEGDLLKTARWAKKEAADFEGADRYDVMIEFLTSELSSRRLSGAEKAISPTE